jgi:outer membrane protein OmpA-like peptidoglycan-associated protein
LLLVAACGCATTGGLSTTDVIEQYPQVGELHAALLDAEKAKAALLAPTGYAESKMYLDLAIEEAQDGNKGKANNAAQRGLSAVAKLNVSLSAFRDAMEDVLETRERAIAAGARNLYSEEMNKVEQDFRELAEKAENGKLDKVLEKRPEILAVYSDLELRALKKGSVEGAKAAIKEADKAGADKWAPKTMKLAREQVKLVSSVLDADRTKVEKAHSHAAKTIWLAGRAMAITSLTKKFDKQDLTNEEIILWFQGQIEEAAEPLGEPLPFDKSDRDAILALRDDISGIKKGLEDTRVVIKQYQEELARVTEAAKKQRAATEIAMREVLNADRKDLVALRQKYADFLSPEGKSSAVTEQREVEVKLRYEEIKAAFNDREATVIMQDANILITLSGIEFAKNKADVSARSFGLLNKVAMAVQKLPEAGIEISGHTEARGKEIKNQEISQQRADAVLKFLTEVGGVDAGRINARGMGSSKPVATNKTTDGRTQNRRIEVLIINRNK